MEYVIYETIKVVLRLGKYEPCVYISRELKLIATSKLRNIN